MYSTEKDSAEENGRRTHKLREELLPIDKKQVQKLREQVTLSKSSADVSILHFTPVSPYYC